jgi:prophage antirepressor-like protein
MPQNEEGIMNELQIFNNEEFGQVRTVEIDGKPYFAASDVAEALGYSNPRDAISRHCKGVVKHDTLTEGGAQSINFIPEGDIYRLIVSSKLPSAERFESWVFDEVIPSIRQTGGYQIPQTYTEALRALADKVEETERLALENKAMAPKAEFFDAVTDSRDAIPMAEVAKVLDMGVGRNKLFEFLRYKKVLQANNVPYQKYIDNGYFRVVEQRFDRGCGDVGINIKTLVFQKGVDFIRRILIEDLESA